MELAPDHKGVVFEFRNFDEVLLFIDSGHHPAVLFECAAESLLIS